jgi:uncharacterized protein
MLANIPLPTSEIADFCQRHHIRKLSLFGSVLRDDFTPQSDIDVLVEFESNARRGYFHLSMMQNELSELLQRDVDLHTPNSLSRYFRQNVLATAEMLYERE